MSYLKLKKICFQLPDVKNKFILEYVEKLNSLHCLKLTLGFNSKIGFFLQMNFPKHVNVDELNLPGLFSILYKKNSTLFIITEQLMVDGQRCKDICDEIHIMSNV